MPAVTSHPRATFFSPEAVRSLPKAAPRTTSNRGRKRKCAILTDTPEKTALEEEARLKEAKKEKARLKEAEKKRKTANIKVNKGNRRVQKGKMDKKGRKSSKQPKDRVKKKILQDSSEEDDDDDTICLGCGSSYFEDTSGVDWVECMSCKLWSHATCIKGDAVAYICTNCNSDSDYDDGFFLWYD